MLRACLLVFALGCGSSQSTSSKNAPAPEPTGGSAAALTAEQCTAQGGEVVGDIGDGAIHRPDYVCPKSGQPPLGHIAAPAGGPVAIEGSVCCR